MLTNDRIIAISCIVDDISKEIGHREDSRRRVSGMLFTIFYQIGDCLKASAGASEYVIDSFP